MKPLRPLVFLCLLAGLTACSGEITGPDTVSTPDMPVYDGGYVGSGG